MRVAEFRLRDLQIELAEERVALRAPHADDLRGVRLADEEPLAPGDGMRAHDRARDVGHRGELRRARHVLVDLAAAACGILALRAGVPAAVVAIAVDRLQALQAAL